MSYKHGRHDTARNLSVCLPVCRVFSNLRDDSLQSLPLESLKRQHDAVQVGGGFQKGTRGNTPLVGEELLSQRRHSFKDLRKKSPQCWGGRQCGKGKEHQVWATQDKKR